MRMLAAIELHPSANCHMTLHADKASPEASFEERWVF